MVDFGSLIWERVRNDFGRVRSRSKLVVTGVDFFVDHSVYVFLDFGGFSSRIGLHTLPDGSPRPANVPRAPRNVFPIVWPRPGTPRLELASKNLQNRPTFIEVPYRSYNGFGLRKFREITTFDYLSIASQRFLRPLYLIS